MQAKNVSSLVQNGKQADSLMVRQMHLTGKHTYIILNKCADDTQHVLYNLNAVGSVGPVQAQLGSLTTRIVLDLLKSRALALEPAPQGWRRYVQRATDGLETGKAIAEIVANHRLHLGGKIVARRIIFHD